MTRLEWLITGDKSVRWPEDVDQLQKDIPELQQLPPETVQRLYSNWSEWAYCAGWLRLDEYAIEEFARWLRVEVGDGSSQELIAADWLSGD